MPDFSSLQIITKEIYLQSLLYHQTHAIALQTATKLAATVTKAINQRSRFPIQFPGAKAIEKINFRLIIWRVVTVVDIMLPAVHRPVIVFR
jgi:hypothetical protein